MIVDCSACAVRGIACGDCVVAVLLGYPGVPTPEAATPPVRSDRMAIDQDEQQALAVLAAAGLVPRLRLAPAVDRARTSPVLSVRDTGAA